MNPEVDENKPGWLSPTRFAFLLCILIGVAYPEVLIGKQSFFFRDFGSYGYPVAFHWRGSVLDGEIPLWNPLNHCGIPFLAQWSTLALYPLSFIYLVGPMPWAVNFFVLLHLFMAGMGMYLLARFYTRNSFAAAIAGMSYVFNGLVINCLMWPHYMVFWAWTPLLILTMERSWRQGGRWQYAAILCGTMQMLSGMPEFILLSWLLIAALWVSQCLTRDLQWRTSGIRFGLAVVCIAGLCAAQLLPFFQLVQWSDRSGSGSPEMWRMPISGLLNFFVPLSGTSPSAMGVFFQSDQWWTSSYYAGVIVIVLAVAGGTFKEVRFRIFAVASLLGVWLALGPTGFLYQVLAAILPPFQMMRFPVKFVMLTNLCLPLLAALAIARLEHRFREGALSSKWLLPAILGGLGVMGVALTVGLNHAGEAMTKPLLINAGGRVLFLVVFFTAFFCLLLSRPGKGRLMCGILCVLVLWGDFRTHVPNQNPTVPSWVYEPGVWNEASGSKPMLGESRLLLTHSARDQFLRRIMPDPLQDYSGRRMGYAANCNLLDAIPKQDGFYSLRVAHESELDAFYRAAFTNDFPSPLADFLAVSQINNATNVLLFESRPRHLPIVTAGQTPLYLSSEEIIGTLMSPEFQPGRTVLLEPTEEPLFEKASAARVRVRKKEFSAHKLVYEVEASADTALVVSQTFYPAWKAYVNGVSVPLVRANHAFQALPIPAGQSAVVIVYEDFYFRAGSIISLVTVVIILAIAALQFRSRRSSSPALSPLS